VPLQEGEDRNGSDGEDPVIPHDYRGAGHARQHIDEPQTAGDFGPLQHHVRRLDNLQCEPLLQSHTRVTARSRGLLRIRWAAYAVGSGNLLTRPWARAPRPNAGYCDTQDSRRGYAESPVLWEIDHSIRAHLMRVAAAKCGVGPSQCGSPRRLNPSGHSSPSVPPLATSRTPTASVSASSAHGSDGMPTIANMAKRWRHHRRAAPS
jgi:hypothetical protein